LIRDAIRGAGKKHPSRSAFPSWLTLIALGFALAVPSDGEPSLPTAESAPYEYDVKAVFLYNFTRYIQWPEALEPEGLTIVVFGESAIVPPLQEIARKAVPTQTPIVVRQCLEIGRIGRPRVLFIARSAVPQIAWVLESVRGTDVLTIGESEGLAARGVAINFVEREGTVKFEMNERSLKEAGIKVSSQLLKLAILVDGEAGGGGR
jgi:hypothetical protein